MKDIVYEVTCKLDQCATRTVTYNGEACRSAHDRLSEHIRAANNPSSYKENAVGQHYAKEHPGKKAKLEFRILDRQTNTQRRAISEAVHIAQNKPQLNNCQEQSSLRNVLICF